MALLFHGGLTLTRGMFFFANMGLDASLSSPCFADKANQVVVCIFVVTDVILQPLFADGFEPKLEVTGCTKAKLKLTVHDAADGGIVYIENTSTTCKQFTKPFISEHVFDVRTCALNWSTTFRVVVQRHPMYMTGEDKRFPVTCIPDTSDLNVGNKMIKAKEKADEEEITKTVRPTATMALYRDGLDVNGKEVKLIDQITMVIQLDEEHSADFDIQAIDCYGGDIQIIRDGCPVDTDLFPKFTRVAQGKLQAVFGVFRPTNLEGGTVNLAFSCSLKVNIGRHARTICDNNREGNVKYKRMLLGDSAVVEEIFVENTLLINTEDNSTGSVQSFTESHGGCVQTEIFTFVLVLLLVSLLFLLVSCVFMQRKLKASRKRIKKLGAIRRARQLYREQRVLDHDEYMSSCDIVFNARNYPSGQFSD